MYYLEVSANTCTCKIAINGLGIDVLNAEKVGSIQYPCNTELTGNANRVEIEIVPSSLDPITLDKIRMDGVVKTYPDNCTIGPESGEVITAFSLQETIEMIKANPFANIAELVPFRVTAEFDSEDSPSFRNRLFETDIIDNKSDLLEWAMQFKNALEQQNSMLLFEMYAPKLQDYDIAFPGDKEPDNAAWFASWMNDTVFPQQPYIDFSKDDIELRRWCDGRVWEIRLKDGGPLWRTLGKEGRRSKIDVYVGMVDKKIKIVR